MHQGIKTCTQCGEDESNEHMIVYKYPKSAYNGGLKVMASKIKQSKVGQTVAPV